jgi:hypothetical protein
VTHARSTAPWWRRAVPDRGERTDLGFSVLLATLAVVGFDSSFGGQEAFTVGIPAVVVGAAVGFAIVRRRPPLLVGCAVGLVGFFLLGGAVALRGDASAGVLPGPDVWSGLVDGTVNGWARLLTTVPPAGQAGNLLAIPYLAGYAGGLFAVVLALLVHRWPACLVPPVGVLALSVLFGVHEPASLLLQGAVFGAATVAWLCLREDRRSRPVITHGSAMRMAGSAGLLAVAVLGAFVVAPRLPLADANERFVLRDRVNPPFEPSQYPSPLARFRDFDGKNPIEGTLLTVDGLPAGAVVRFAVMDAYDGNVWRASPPGAGLGGTYQRVGDRIPGAADGEKATVRFTMGDLATRDSVWIPTAGSPTALRFTGSNGPALTEAFRFNRATETAASPVALAAGDTWEVDATFPFAPADGDMAGRGALLDAPEPFGLSGNRDITDQLAEWTEGTTSPFEKVQQLVKNLIEDGAYNNGSSNEHPIASGHSLWRLAHFITASQPQGNGEQYSAAVAYLAQAMGIPARVVLEFTGAGPGPVEVKVEDVRASVEIALDGVGWVRVADPTPPKDDEPDTQLLQDDPEPKNEVQPPPPTTLPPPLDLPEEPERKEPESREAEADPGGSGVLAAVLRVAAVTSIPAVVLVGPGLVVVALKARRRSRRRKRGAPAARIAGGWHEIVDLARDMGHPVPPKATRREVARFAAPAAGDLAEHVDASVFGHAEPDDTVATSVWERVDEVRRAMVAQRSRKDRLRAAVSLTSLRVGR